jgi:hypothetical protein
MIQYEFPGVVAPMYRLRVRRLSGFALAGYPIGFALFAIGGDAHPPAPITIAGVTIMLAAFVAALCIIPTGIQRIAAGVEQGLDEFQLAARLKAQSSAYRWFSGWVFLMVAYANIASVFGMTFTIAGNAMSAIVFWVITYATVLPAWFLSGALPEAVEGDE